MCCAIIYKLDNYTPYKLCTTTTFIIYISCVSGTKSIINMFAFNLCLFANFYLKPQNCVHGTVGMWFLWGK